MSILAIAGNALRRLLRDRANLFFVFAFPLLLVLMLGNAFGAADVATLAVAVSGDDAVSQAIVQELRSNERTVVRIVPDLGAVRDTVARGQAAGGIAIPADIALPGQHGGVEVAYVQGNDARSPLLLAPVQQAVARADALLFASSFAEERTGAGPDAALAAAVRAASSSLGDDVTVRWAGRDEGDPLSAYEDEGVFALVTHQQLLLFVFLTSLTAANALIQSRELGVARRMLAAPVTVGAILAGEALGRFSVALFQAFTIVVGTGVLFGVGWGSVGGWLPLVAAFALVSSGAGMLLGSVFDNESQTGGVGVLLGLGLAAIGGCMVPLEMFSPTMQTIAHITPHAWALDGFFDLVRAGGGPAEVADEVAILLVYGAAVLGLATWALRRALLRST